MRIHRRIAALSGAMLSATALVALPAAHANAASNCWTNNQYMYAPYFGLSYEVYFCNNLGGVPVHEFPDSGTVVGYMNSTTSWFLCRDDYGDLNGEFSSTHGRRWLYTEADNGQWGFMNDKNISSETDPVGEC